MRLASGEVIGSYRLIRLIGQGGMGEVYEAEHSGLRKRMALKVFTADGAKADFLRKRFLAEGRILARLDHPRLVKVHDLGLDERRDMPYFAMDLVVGADGSPWSLERWRQERKPDEPAIAAVYDDLRKGLEYLHAKGVVHRDVKLENVLIDKTGRAVLSDFGVSRIFDEGLRRELSVTVTFAADKAPIMGSFGYLAPELKRGEPATPAADAYALGVLVFRLLTGVWYENDSSAMDLLAGFDEGWTTLLTQLLAEDPSKRLPLSELVLRSPTVGCDLRAHRNRLKTQIAFALGLIAVILGVCLYFVSRPYHYDFDEFFPPDEEVMR